MTAAPSDRCRRRMALIPAGVFNMGPTTFSCPAREPLDSIVSWTYIFFVIVEQLPEVQRLSPERKLTLAAELFEDATDCRAEHPDPEIVRLLDERLAEHRENPTSATPWNEVKARILGDRES